MPLGVWRDIIGNSDVVRALWLQIVQWVEINSDSEVIKSEIFAVLMIIKVKVIIEKSRGGKFLWNMN